MYSFSYILLRAQARQLQLRGARRGARPAGILPGVSRAARAAAATAWPWRGAAPWRPPPRRTRRPPHAARPAAPAPRRVWLTGASTHPQAVARTPPPPVPWPPPQAPASSSSSAHSPRHWRARWRSEELHCRGALLLRVRQLLRQRRRAIIMVYVDALGSVTYYYLFMSLCLMRTLKSILQSLIRLHVNPKRQLVRT
jgi:hypothetical protein